ncbi:interferon-inducible GTPase 5-like isoform X2 [Simochromis diagramma]|uniref:interferon-inducible GTPase 5-like isoform X2 n=1 Tax=Simochromis diagramma TaxID=43689 RepID=UPI001A7ED49C|nr:interferon-inducible GTPase 5-like isoform X2 [Simochromis diagramma]
MHHHLLPVHGGYFCQHHCQYFQWLQWSRVCYPAPGFQHHCDTKDPHKHNAAVFVMFIGSFFLRFLSAALQLTSSWSSLLSVAVCCRQDWTQMQPRMFSQVFFFCLRISMEDPIDSHPEEIPGVREDLENNDIAAAAAMIQQYLERENNIPLNIAITGETGSGKSTFVNALRGMFDDDEGAAPTGVTETTSEVKPYPHPNYPNVKLWDLPGIGSTKFPADEYLELVGFEKFDFFIIISDTRFRENDVKLAQEIQRMKKKFYFVHSKVDDNLRAERRKRDFNEEETLTKIREDCVHRLRRSGIESPQVFLVSSFKLHLYDFSLLHQTLERDLPKHKRHALLRAMPNISLEIINKKKKAFQSKIKYYSILSAAVAGVPVPALSIAVDLALLVGVVTHYVHAFGLDIQSLKRLSARTGVPYTDLCAVIISPLAAAEITTELLLKVMTQLVGVVKLIAAEEVSRLTLTAGIPAAMGLSFTITYTILNAIINQLADDAHRVFAKSLGL